MAVVSGSERVTADFSSVPSENLPEKKEMPRVADHVEPLPSAADLLSKALSPDLTHLPREQIIKIQLAVLQRPEEKFPLAIELFKIKAAAFKNAGGAMEEFAQERRDEIKKNGALNNLLSPVVTLVVRPRSGEHKDLKRELRTLYYHLLTLAVDQYKNGTLDRPYVELFDLEQQTEYEVNKFQLLLGDFDYSCQRFFKEKERHKLLSMESFYWETFVPQLEDLLRYLDKEGASEECTSLLTQYMRVVRYCGYDANRDFVRFLRLSNYFVKYGSLVQAKEYYNYHLAESSYADQAYWWAGYLCRVAEHVAPKDQKQALDYLKGGTAEIEKHMAPSFFESAQIKQRREAILSRIEEARANITAQKP
jgi:hypothetical protein